MNEIKKFEVCFNKSLGPLTLGMRKTEVDKILGEEANKNRDIYYYYNNHLQLEFDNKNALIFIQLCSNQEIIPTFNDINLFELDDYKIDKLLNAYGAVDKNDPEYGCTFNYRSLQLIFWRGSNPEKLKLELEALDKTDEEYFEQLKFYEDEIDKHKYFETVAVYSKDYYNSLEG